jgi:multiple sugar transport system ATP-binding protein
MAHLEIDRLKLANQANLGNTSLDLQLEKGGIGCLFSRNTYELNAIADAITGLGKSYEGRIFLGGNVIDTTHPGRTGVSACGFRVGLYDHLRAADNLALPLKTSGMSDFEILARVDATLDDFGFTELAMEYPENLDEGEKLKLSFAKAAMSSPELIVCYLTNSQNSGFALYPLLADIKRHASGNELTVLAITDDGFFALTLGDQIAYLYEGNIIQQGSPRDVINSPERLEVAQDFAFPKLNAFEGLVTEESPFLFVENQDQFFNLPTRLRDYFRARIGSHQLMAVRPERVQLVHPEEVQRKGRNIVNVSRIDYFGFGIFAYFDFGEWEWCAFLPANKVAYPGMEMGVYVPEEEWFFLDDDGKVLLDL